MHRKFLASAATPCLIKFTADPDHLSVNTGEVANTFLLTWRLLYLKWTPHRNCQLAPEKLLFSELHWNSRQGEYLFRGSNWAYLLGDPIEDFFFLLYGVCLSQAAMGKIALAWKHMAHNKHLLWGFWWYILAAHICYNGTICLSLS